MENKQENGLGSAVPGVLIPTTELILASKSEGETVSGSGHDSRLNGLKKFNWLHLFGYLTES